MHWMGTGFPEFRLTVSSDKRMSCACENKFKNNLFRISRLNIIHRLHHVSTTIAGIRDTVKRLIAAHNATRKCRSYISILRTILYAALFLQGFCNVFSFELCTLPASVINLPTVNWYSEIYRRYHLNVALK